MEFKKFIAERKRMCKAHSDGVVCSCVRMKCPLNELRERCPENSCYAGCTRYPEEAERIISEWSENNPPMTNLEKYKQVMHEVFGIIVDEESIYPVLEGRRPINWWNKPYKEPEK